VTAIRPDLDERETAAALAALSPQLSRTPGRPEAVYEVYAPVNDFGLDRACGAHRSRGLYAQNSRASAGLRSWIAKILLVEAFEKVGVTAVKRCGFKHAEDRKAKDSLTECAAGETNGAPGAHSTLCGGSGCEQGLFQEPNLINDQVSVAYQHPIEQKAHGILPNARIRAASIRSTTPLRSGRPSQGEHQRGAADDGSHDRIDLIWPCAIRVRVSRHLNRTAEQSASRPQPLRVVPVEITQRNARLRVVDCVCEFEAAVEERIQRSLAPVGALRLSMALDAARARRM